MARLKLELFGSFKIWLNNKPTAGLFRSEKERALLAYLAVEAGRPYSREALAEFFWPGRPRGMARASLRQALSGVRKVLGDKDSDTPFCLISDQTIQFNPDSDYWLDVNAFQSLFRSVLFHQHESVDDCDVCIDSLQQAIQLYKGSFLDDFYHVESLEYKEWLACHREQYFRYMLTALQKIGRYYENKGSVEEALGYLQRQVSLDPLDEGPHRKLMELLAVSGKRASALEQYNICKSLLAEEIGVEPAPETQEIFRLIKLGKLGGLKKIPSSPLKPRAEMTAFFGRQVELERFSRCLDNPVCRLLTMVGPPGAGKTRLAMKVAALHEADFNDGIFILHAEQLNASAELAPVLARVLGLTVEPLSGLPGRLLEHLGGLNALLLIDGFEHLLDKTELLLDILQHSPGVKILATSRERFNYQAACLFDIRGLSFPEDGKIDDPERYAAFNLFVTRAGNSRSGFKATERNIPSIMKICQQVEGNPLALELAAARLREYTCYEIAQSLENSIHLLNTSFKDVPANHRSMGNALNQVWGSLTPAQKDSYFKLKTIQGRFLAEDAQRAAGISVAQLALFVEKCLLVKDHLGCYQVPSLFRLFLNDLGCMAESKERRHDEVRLDTSHYVDQLTGLATKELFWDRLNHSLAFSRRKQQLFALMLIDLRCILQHKILLPSEKEAVQKMIADRLRSSLRLSDTIARLSQDEYILIVEDLPEVSSSEIVARKILAVLEEDYEIGVDRHKLPVRIGISIYPMDGDTASDLLARSRNALEKLEAGKFGRSYYSPVKSKISG